MKQLLFMIFMTLIGTGGVFFAPMCGVVVYYLFAVLRPQYLWQWVLPQDVSWSMFVAIGTLVGAGLYLMGASPGAAAVTKRRRTFGAPHMAMLLFGLWIFVTYMTAQNQEVAWPWLLEYMKIFLMFFVSSLLILTVRHVWILMITAALALGYIAYEVNYLYFVNHYMGIYFNGYGGLDNNGAGLMLAMGIPLCLFVYMGTKRWWRWGFALLIPLILHSVLMTFSRGAMVSLIVASPLMFLRGKHRFQLALALTAMISVVPLMAGPDIRARFFTLENYQDEGSAKSRFGSWEAAYRIAKDYPIFGVGVRNSNLFSMDYGADMEGRTIHSQFLQVLADNGFPGLVFYLATFACVIVRLRKVRRWARHRSSDEARLAYAAACGIESALAVFCIGAMFLSLEVFELPYLLLLIGAQLPLVVQMDTPEAREGTANEPLTGESLAGGPRPAHAVVGL